MWMRPERGLGVAGLRVRKSEGLWLGMAEPSKMQMFLSERLAFAHRL